MTARTRGVFTVQILRISESRHDPVLGPEGCLAVLRPVFAAIDADREHLVMLCLNARHSVTGHKVVATGGVSQAVSDPRTIFRDALFLGASSIVLAHNHPSGDPEPSIDDIQFTRRISEAGRMIGITVLDHIILGTGDAFVSLAARGDVQP